MQTKRLDMKKLDWNILVLAGLAVLAVLASLFSPTLVVSTAVCFIGILGFWAWGRWLEFRDKQEIRDAVTPLEKQLEAQKQELAVLQSKLADAETKLKNAQSELPPVEKRLFEMAEKLRTKTIVQTKNGTETTTTTTDEVPGKVCEFIVEQLKSIFSPDKNTKK